MFMESKLVGLREVEKEDLELFKRWRNIEEETRNYRTVGPLTAKNQDWYWENIVNSDSHKVFTILKKDTMAIIGEIRLSYMNLLDGNAEIGILLDTKQRGKGFGLEALNLILDFGFNRMRLNRIEAQYTENNTNSAKLFKKAGFIIEGVRRSSKYFDGRYNNVVISSILASEYKRVFI